MSWGPTCSTARSAFRRMGATLAANGMGTPVAKEVKTGEGARQEHPSSRTFLNIVTSGLRQIWQAISVWGSGFLRNLSSGERAQLGQSRMSGAGQQGGGGCGQRRPPDREPETPDPLEQVPRARRTTEPARVLADRRRLAGRSLQCNAYGLRFHFGADGGRLRGPRAWVLSNSRSTSLGRFDDLTAFCGWALVDNTWYGRWRLREDGADGRVRLEAELLDPRGPTATALQTLQVSLRRRLQHRRAHAAIISGGIMLARKKLQEIVAASRATMPALLS